VGRDEIDYVNAHASSTPLGDVAEARALAAALDGHARDVPLSRTNAPHGHPRNVPVSGARALYGHPLGASSALEAAICSMTIRDGWAPGTTNLASIDPEIGALLPGLLRAGREGTYERILSTSFGFGGLNAALVFGAVPSA